MGHAANPSFKTGFYSPRRGVTPKYPALWRNCIGAWCPSLGETGKVLFNHALTGSNGNGTFSAGMSASNWVVRDKTAIELNSSSDIATNLAWPATNNQGVSFSFWTWIAASNSSQQSSVLNFGFTSDRIQLHCPYDGVIYWDAGNTTSGRISVSMAGYFDRWIHVATTSRSGFQAIYLDGKLMTSQNSGVTLNIALPTLKISDPGFRHLGFIDDVRVYSRSLYPQEVRLLASRRGVAYEHSDENYYITSAPPPVNDSRNNLLAGAAF